MEEEKLLWVSDWNRSPEVLGNDAKFPERLKFYDTTLRDGEQSIGVTFSKEEKLEIARMLDELGVDRIEAGWPVVSREDREAVERIAASGLKAEIWALCRSVKGDVDACVDVGVRHIICEVATSPLKWRAYNYTAERVLDMVLGTLEYAKNRGLYTAFFAVDATRADPAFLETIYKRAVEEGKADEVVLVDTLGVATPETMLFLTKKLREWVNVPIMTHCHNDFGMATACTMASVKGGAEYAHVTVNGLGEKTGNADLAEIALAARLYGIGTGIDMKKLYPAAKLVERCSKIPISVLKPVVGEHVFKKESGGVVAQLASFPPAVEGYSPELVGREREVLLSKKSGKKSIEYKLKPLGLTGTPDQLEAILQKVKEAGNRNKGPVSDQEFSGIVRDYQKTGALRKSPA